jgi:hypothetical protein
MAALFAVLSTAAFAADALVPGATVTYRDPFGRAWCATIQSVEIGVAGIPTAWVTIDADPRRVFQTALSELTPGCSR